MTFRHGNVEREVGCENFEKELEGLILVATFNFS